MAVAYDSSDTGAVVGGNSYSGSFTNTAGDILFVLTCIDRGSGDYAVSSVTYNGVAVVQDNQDVVASAYRYQLFILGAPATGANTLAISVSGNTNFQWSVITYSGVGRKGASIYASGTSTTPTADLWNEYNDSMLVNFLAADTTGAGEMTAGATERINVSASGYSNGIQDTLLTAPTTTTMSWTLSGSVKWSSFIVELVPAGYNVKTLPTGRPRRFFLNTNSAQSRGLVGCYPFSEGGGSVTKDLMITKRYDGTVSPTGWGTNGMSLNGSSQAVALGTAAAQNYDDMTVGTFGAWVRCTGAPGVLMGIGLTITDLTGQEIFSIGGSPFNNQDDSTYLWIYTTGYQFRAYIRRGHNYYLDNEWHHIVYAMGSSGNTFYVDGIDMAPYMGYATGNASTGNLFLRPQSNSGYFNFGNRWRLSAQTGYLKSEMAEVRIYNYQLSSTEVSTWYKNPWDLYKISVPTRVSPPMVNVSVQESVTMSDTPTVVKVLAINVQEPVSVLDSAGIVGRDLYWVGGTGSWSDATNHWATSSGGAPGAGNLPTIFDNVHFDSNSSTASAAYTMTIGAAALCRDFIMDGPGGGNKVTWAGSSTLDIYGSLNLVGGTGGITRSYAGDIGFYSSLIGKTITLNGISLSSNIAFGNATGSWTFQDTFVTASTKTVTLAYGWLNMNSQTVTMGAFVSSNSNVRRLELGTAAITINGTSGAWNFSTTTGLTFVGDKSSITFSGATSIFQSGGQTYGDLVLSNTAWHILYYQGATCTNFTISGNFFLFTYNNADTGGSPLTVLGTFTGSGSSQVNRVFCFNGSSAGFMVDAATVSLSNIDFSGLTAGGVGTWSGTSVGDAGGNDGLTPTASVNRFWVGTSGGNWYDTANWSASTGGAGGETMPLPQDNVTFDANSIGSGGRTITVNTGVFQIGSNVNFSAVTNNPALGISANPGVPKVLKGNFTGGTFTSSTSSTFFLAITEGDSVFTSNGVSFGFGIQFSATKQRSNSWTLADDYVNTSNSTSGGFARGTFNTANKNLTVTQWINGSTSYAGTINMGSSLFTITGAGTIWAGSSLTVVNAGTSVIKLTNISATTKTFAGAGKTYNDFYITGTGTGSYAITGSNTFAEFKDDNTSAHSLVFTAGTTTTVDTFLVNGTNPNQVTINSSDTNVHYLVKSSDGVINTDFLNIQHSVATPENRWFTGPNSTDNQSTATAGSGWIFDTLGVGNPFPSETIAVNESTSFRFTTYLSISDSSAVSDTPTIAITSFLSVSDSVTVDDSAGMIEVLNISVSDETAVADSVQIFEEEFLVSASDTITVSDTVQMAGVLYFSVTDSVGVTDTPVVDLRVSISISESTAVSDEPAMQMVSFISLYDVVTVTDSDQIAPIRYPDASDTVVVTESVAVYITVLMLSVSDSVSVADSSTEEIISSVDVSDTASLSDSASLQVFSFVLVSDSSSVTDTVNMEEVSFVSASETATVQETIDIKISSFLDVQDIVTVADSATLVEFSYVSLSDTTAVSDSANLEILSFVVVSDSTAISDSADLRIPLYIGVSDTSAVGESVEARVLSFVSIQETVVVSDDPIIEIVLQGLSVSDETVVSDTATILFGNINISVTDSSAVSDEVTILVKSLVSVFDTVIVSDSPELKVSDPQVVVSEEVIVSDAPTIETILQSLSVLDSVGVTDSPVLSLSNLIISVSDSTAVSDTIFIYERSAPFDADIVAVFDSVNLRVSDPQVQTLDTVTVSDSPVIEIIIQGLVVSDETAVSDTPNIFITNLVFSVSDSSAVSDSNTVYIVTGPDVVETIVVSDTAIITVSDPQVQASESIIVTDTPALESILQGVVVSDTVTVTDTPEVFITILFVDVSDETSVSDAVNVLEIYYLYAEDSSPVSDSVAAELDLFNVQVSDVVSVSDATQEEVVSFVVVQDDITVTDSAQLNFTVILSVSDTVVVTDSATDSPTSYLSVFDETAVTDTPEIFVPVLTLGVSETVTVIDSETSSGTHYVSVSDESAVSDSAAIDVRVVLPLIEETVVVSDAVTFSVISFVSVSDSILVTDSVDLRVFSNIQVSDQVAVSDSVEISLTSYILVSDSVPVSDVPDLFIPVLVISVSDATVVSDTIFFAGSDYVQVSDSVVVTDSPIIFLPLLVVSVSDSTAVSDVIFIFEENEPIVTDFTAVSDTPAISLTSYISVQDSTPVSDTTEDYAVNFFAVDDSVSVTDSSSFEVVSYIDVFDSVSVGEEVMMSGTLNIFAEDSVAVSDSAAESIEVNVDVQDSVAVTEIVELSEGIDVHAQEDITVVDTPNVFIPVLVVSVSDIVTPIEVIFVFQGNNIGATDFTVVSDEAVLFLPELFVSLHDDAVVSDTPEINLRSYLDVSDTTSVSDGPSIDVRVEVVVIDTTVVSDSGEVNTVISSLSAGDQVVVSDSPDLRLTSYVNVVENIVVSDSSGSTVGLEASTSDSLVVSDIPVISLILMVSTTDSSNVSDTPTIAVALSGIYVTDTVVVTDSVQSQGDLLISVSDSSAMNDVAGIRNQPTIVPYGIQLGWHYDQYVIQSGNVSSN